MITNNKLINNDLINTKYVIIPSNSLPTPQCYRANRALQLTGKCASESELKTLKTPFKDTLRSSHGRCSVKKSCS